MFSGSYLTQDVTFLLKKIDIPSTSVEDKERLIQKQSQHYSEMITHEKAPTQAYMDIFYASLERNGEQFAQDIFTLSHKIHSDYPEYNNNEDKNADKYTTEEKKREIVIVSLARAGTPVGVLVHRTLKQYFSRTTKHYTISILRDKGIDSNAIDYILQHHRDQDIVFIDGWTGKGVIGEELKKSILKYNLIHYTNISSNLYVVADISGTAYYSATHMDYLLPSAVLNSTVSGLISRTILHPDYILPHDYHGCLFYQHLKEHDVSQYFIDYIEQKISVISNKSITDYIKKEPKDNVNNSIIELKQQSLATIDYFTTLYNLTSRNYIKPGVGESTRVLLRRTPKVIWLKDPHSPQVQHLVYLAKDKNIPIEIKTDLAYSAVAIIEESD